MAYVDVMQEFFRRLRWPEVPPRPGPHPTPIRTTTGEKRSPVVTRGLGIDTPPGERERADFISGKLGLNNGRLITTDDGKVGEIITGKISQQEFPVKPGQPKGKPQEPRAKPRVTTRYFRAAGGAALSTGLAFDITLPGIEMERIRAVHVYNYTHFAVYVQLGTGNSAGPRSYLYRANPFTEITRLINIQDGVNAELDNLPDGTVAAARSNEEAYVEITDDENLTQTTFNL